MSAAWLRPVHDALDARETPVPVFVRDDDAGWAPDRLRGVLEAAEASDVPVDVAVIPLEVDATLARDLTGRVERGAVRVHQHGLRHVDHERAGPGRAVRKHEFGPSRERADHLRDVAAGRERMRDWFGDLVDPVFTPPWNRCTSDTAWAAAACGLRLLSRDRGARPLDLYGLAEMPVTVDWFGKRKGERWTRAELGRRLADDLRGPGPTGLMLHHAITDDEELSDLRALLAVLGSHTAVAPTTIMAVHRSIMVPGGV